MGGFGSVPNTPTLQTSNSSASFACFCIQLDEGESTGQIRAAAWDQAQVTDASLLVIMCADQEAYRKDPARYWSHAPKQVQDILVPAMIPFYDGKPQLARDEAIRSSALGGMTLMLAAKGLGYDSCPMVGFDADAVAKLINLPDDHVISFMIAIGKPTKAAWPRGDRLADDEVVVTNKFGASGHSGSRAAASWTWRTRSGGVGPGRGCSQPTAPRRAGSFSGGRRGRTSNCAEIVERKKQSIDSILIQENPIVREVLSGDNTFVGIYDSFSRSYRGLRRFVPHAHDDALNTRLEHFSRIVPNVAHFKRRSICAADNPITCTLYGMIAGLAAGIVWAQLIHDIGDAAGKAETDAAAYYFLGVIFGFGGFVAGSVAMIRYRTWDPRQIHTREAAAYMDLNYEFYRKQDDEGWAHFIRTAGDAQRQAIQPKT